MKKIQNCLSDFFFSFLVVNFSVYLNRPVFIMFLLHTKVPHNNIGFTYPGYQIGSFVSRCGCHTGLIYQTLTLSMLEKHIRRHSEILSRKKALTLHANCLHFEIYFFVFPENRL